MRQYSRLTDTQSKKFESNQKKRTYLVAFLIILNIFLFIFSISKISFLNFLQIRDIVVTGVKSDVSYKIQSQAQDILDGGYLGLFSRANLVLYPKGRLMSAVLQVAPEIQAVSITRNGFRGLKIDVSQKQPSAVVCASLPDDSFSNDVGDSDCYLVDWSGYIFDKMSTSSNETDITIEGANLYFAPELDVATNYATTTGEFVSLQKFYNGSKESGLNPKYILIKDDGEYEMYADDTVVYFSNKSSMEEQLQNLVTFWNHSRNKDEVISYEYIDIRFGSNVFYRKK